MMDSGDEYHFRPYRKYQGLAVVIVNFTKERSGSKEDITKLRETFEILGFKVKIYKDLTKEKFDKKVNKYSKGDKLKDYDSFVFAISTHGCEQEKVENNIVVHHHALLMNDLQYYYTATVLEKFKKCEALEEKPKIFFIQACRIPISMSSEIYRAQGIGFDKGVCLQKLSQEEPSKKKRKLDKTDHEVLDSDPKILSEVGEDAADTAMESFSDDCEMGDSQSNSEDVLSTATKIGKLSDDPDAPRAIRYQPSQALLHITAVPCHNDMLIMFASPEGKYAFRNQVMGSFMWIYLHDSVKTEYGEGQLLSNRTNFLYILNDVAAKMSSTVFCDGKYKNVTCIVHKLSKDIIFSKGEKM
ncbi:caspase-1-like [Saccostrea echinata]|uniref:caspase-1-like n=1 Tax=Saccostrea echinata TaxID=191078 RepID=UPI002A8315F1|nr:caspase-1-like [Saccostrea echinata]